MAPNLSLLKPCIGMQMSFRTFNLARLIVRFDFQQQQSKLKSISAMKLTTPEAATYAFMQILELPVDDTTPGRISSKFHDYFKKVMCKVDLLEHRSEEFWLHCFHGLVSLQRASKYLSAIAMPPWSAPFSTVNQDRPIFIDLDSGFDNTLIAGFASLHWHPQAQFKVRLYESLLIASGMLLSSLQNNWSTTTCPAYHRKIFLCCVASKQAETVEARHWDSRSSCNDTLAAGLKISRDSTRGTRLRPNLYFPQLCPGNEAGCSGVSHLLFGALRSGL